jgi:hypothetical protein
MDSWGRARYQLVDSGSTLRWTDAELLQWLSEGQRAIVLALPEASQTIATVALFAGTRQIVPAGGHILLSVNRNLTFGGVAGQVCRQVDRTLMDTQYPTWHTDTQSPTALFYVYDRHHDPMAFYVYPPNNGGGAVELNYSVMPVDVVLTSTIITVRDIYQVPLLDFILYKAHAKDSDYSAGMSVSQAYFQLFAAAIATQKGPNA